MSPDRSSSPSPAAPGGRAAAGGAGKLIERAGHGVLVTLLALLGLGALTIDRSAWSSFLGDETTYLMAAESLAWDFDLRYEKEDYERFVRHWNTRPEGLILQSIDGGRNITFGKPFFYPAFISPFVRASPTRGPFVANVLLLATAAVLAARTLRRSLGRAAPFWVATFLFASVTFSYAFWAHADLFLMSLCAAALALVLADRETASAGPDPGSRRGLFPRWLAAGLLLAIVVFSRPVYLPMLLPPLLAAPRASRWRAWSAFALGVAILTLAAGSAHQAISGTWTSYGGERGGFYSSTGFPDVDFPTAQWTDAIHRSGNVAWGSWQLAEAQATVDRAGRASLWVWNGLYFLAGRHVGILPYFLPLLLGLVAAPRRWAPWALVAAVAVCFAGLLSFRPFNFYGGGAAIANRYFLPVYPAFWFLVGRRRGLVWPALAVLLAAPFLWPLWAQGSAYPRTPGLTWRYVSPAANELLPYETTQSHLKPAGQEDTRHHGLWIKLLDPDVRSTDGGAFALLPGTEGAMLVGSEQPLDGLWLVTTRPGAEIEVAGAEVVERFDGADGRRLRLLPRRRARHPMWWTTQPFHLYEIRLGLGPEVSEPVLFTLRPAGTGQSALGDRLP